VDSSTFLALVLGDPATQPMYQAMGFDPASTIIVYAATGAPTEVTGLGRTG
jgi:hypothetical protein